MAPSTCLTVTLRILLAISLPMVSSLKINDRFVDETLGDIQHVQQREEYIPPTDMWVVDGCPNFYHPNPFNGKGEAVESRICENGKAYDLEGWKPENHNPPNEGKSWTCDATREVMSAKAGAPVCCRDDLSGGPVPQCQAMCAPGKPKFKRAADSISWDDANRICQGLKAQDLKYSKSKKEFTMLEDDGFGPWRLCQAHELFGMEGVVPPTGDRRPGGGPCCGLACGYDVRVVWTATPGYTWGWRDPHAMNVKGEKFDIMAQGWMYFVRYPQIASLETAGLLINSKIVPAKDCHETYIQEVDISGTWLNGLHVGFRSDQWKPDLEMYVKGKWNSSNTELTKLKKFQGNQRVTMGLQKQPGGVTYDEMSGSLGKLHFKSVTKDAVQLEIGDKTVGVVGVSINLDHNHVKNSFHKKVYFLNLNVDGLAGLPHKVGGIIGHDDHHWVETPTNCDLSETNSDIGLFHSLRNVSQPLLSQHSDVHMSKVHVS